MWPRGLDWVDSDMGEGIFGGKVIAQRGYTNGSPRGAGNAAGTGDAFREGDGAGDIDGRVGRVGGELQAVIGRE